MKILCVAEKPSIARAVAQILAGGRFETSNTQSPFTKNFKFTSRFPDWGQCDVVFTSVAGHLTTAEFGQQWQKWNQCPPDALFEEARIVELIPQVTSAGREFWADGGLGKQGDLRQYCEGE
jgi:DNA topoisomerase-3